MLKAIPQKKLQQYLIVHPEINEKLPKEPQILFILKDGPEFIKHKRRLADNLKKEGQPIIFVEVERVLPPFESRLVNPHIEFASAS
jgi:hypothetical protein